MKFLILTFVIGFLELSGGIEFTILLDRGAAPIGEPAETAFSVFSLDRKLTSKDSAEIWEVTEKGRRIRSLGKVAVTNRDVNGSLTLLTTLHHQKEGPHFYIAEIHLSSGERLQSQRAQIIFHDKTQMISRLEACQKAHKKLLSSIPKVNLTADECTEKGGQVEGGGLFCGPGTKPATRICKTGEPIGAVTGLRCRCYCCR